MQVQTEASSDHLKSRMVNELPSVGRIKIGRSRNSSLRSRPRYEAMRTLYPDADVELRVMQVLGGLHFTTLVELDVVVDQSEATITGEVNSFYEKQLAMSSCLAVPGVLRFIDRIEVRDRCSNRG